MVGLAGRRGGRLVLMDDELTKEYLLGGLRGVRATMLWKLEGLGEYDVRRPLLTATGHEPPGVW